MRSASRLVINTVGPEPAQKSVAQLSGGVDQMLAVVEHDQQLRVP